MTLPVKWVHFHLVDDGDAVQMRAPNDKVVGTVAHFPKTDDVLVKIDNPMLFKQWIQSSETLPRTIELDGKIVEFDVKHWEEFLRLTRRIIRDDRLDDRCLGL